MKRNAFLASAALAILASAAGCAVDGGYELPPVGNGRSGGYLPYGPYPPGYYGGGSLYYYGSPYYYDPRGYGYPGYGPYGFDRYPYGGYYAPYPRYFPVPPCIDRDRDGRCDRPPRHHDGEPPHDGTPHDGTPHDGIPRDWRPHDRAPRDVAPPGREGSGNRRQDTERHRRGEPRDGDDDARPRRPKWPASPQGQTSPQS